MSERNAFGVILGALHEAALDDARWPAASARIDEAFGSKGNILVVAEGASEEDLRILFSQHLFRGERRPELEREYFATYHAVDERVPRLRRLPDGQLVHVRDLYAEGKRKTSATYNEILPRAHAQNSLNVRLDGPSGTRINWSIADPVDDDGWSSGRIAMIRRVLPHLRHYVHVRHALAESGALGAALAALLDETGAGIIQLDRRGRIAAANDRAASLLREGDGLIDPKGFIRARSPDDDVVLQGLLARALPRSRGGAKGGGSMTVRRSTGRPALALHMNPVPGGGGGFGTSRAAVLVLVVDGGLPTRIDPAAVAAALRLTPMEGKVAAWLAEGRTVRDIAAATGRSQKTIHWHVRHIYEKHGISRQVDLARLVLSSVAPPSFGIRPQ